MIPIVRKQVERDSHLIELLRCELILEHGAYLDQKRVEDCSFVNHGKSSEHCPHDFIVLVPADKVGVTARRNQSRSNAIERYASALLSKVADSFKQHEDKGSFRTLRTLAFDSNHPSESRLVERRAVSCGRSL